MSEAEAQVTEQETPPPDKGSVSDSQPEKSPVANGSEAKNGSGDSADATDAKTLAQGGEAEKPDPKSYWPEDWRQRAAEHISAGDEKLLKRELKRLERFTDPSGIYAMARELEGKFTSGNLIKKPGEGASEEDIAAYHKSIGVPTKEDYFKDLKLADGSVLGDEDREMAESFIDAVLPAGMPKEAADAALNWYFQNEEEAASQLDDMDESYRIESERELKEEYGNGYRRRINNIASLFSKAPGGADVDNEGSVYARLMGGRTADGTLIGNDPDVVRFLASLAQELNPAGSVVEDADASGQSINDRIAEIEKVMREDRRTYDKDPGMQARYRELIEARDRVQARA